METTKYYFSVWAKPIFFHFLLTLFLLGHVSSPSLFAQKRVKFKDISPKIESAKITQREKTQLLLKIEKRDKYYPLAITHLHKIYLQNSRKISIRKPQDDLIFLLDSSIYFTGKVLASVKGDFYDKNKGEIIGILGLPTDLSYNDFIAQIEEELAHQSESKVLIPNLFSHYENAIHHLEKANNDFQEIRVKHSNKNELYFLSDSLYEITTEALKSHFFDFKNSFSQYQNTADSFPYGIEKIIVNYTPIQNYHTVLENNYTIANDTLNVKNYQKWWLDLELTRENQIQEFWKEMITTDKLLSSLIDTLSNDTLRLTQQLDSLTIEDKLIKELAPESISLLLFDYQYKKASLLNSFNSEKKFNPEEHERNDIIKYYYGLKTKVNHLEKSFDLLLQSSSDTLKLKKIYPFLQTQYDGEKGYEKFLETNSNEIKQKELYCDEKIRDQLLKIYFEKKFLPNYATYKDLEIALFEQPMATILEKDHFLTLKVINLENGIKYISGYKRGEEKIPFVAKASKQKIIWLETLNSKLKKGGNVNGVANLITFDGRNLTTVVTSENEDAKLKYLFEINDEGEIISNLALKNEEQIDLIFKNTEDSLTILGYQLREEAYIIEGLSGDLEARWNLSFPYSIRFPKILHNQGNYVFIANVSPTSNTTLSSIDAKENFSNLMIAIINSSGEIKFQKVLESSTSQFFTHTLKLENKAILILGFNGSMDLNNFENKSLLTLEFNPQEELPTVGDGLGKR